MSGFSGISELSGGLFLIKNKVMRKTLFLLFGLALSLSANAENITFADPHVKTVCVGHWDTDGDGELSMDEAAAVTSLNHYFTRDAAITSFDELQYFTGLTRVLSSEFNDCESLKSIQLPAQVQRIGDNAFRDCYQLQSIDIPAQVTTIDFNAFSGCFRLSEVTLHEGLKTIGETAFISCRALQGLDIPASLTKIAASAFKGCSSIASITVHIDNTVYDSRDNCNAIVKTANNEMMLGCHNSTFPETVTSIGASAFSGCQLLQKIDIPEGIVTIGTSAFSGCTGLTDIVLPATLTTIGNSAFSGCTRLTNVQLPEGLETIEAAAFRDCRNVISVSLPSTLSSLSNNVFYECPALVEVIVNFSTPLSITSTTFSNCTNATLYVPEGCVQAFRDAKYWRDFYQVLEHPILGDVNHDGFVNIYDVTLMIDYILGLNPENFHVAEADINDDTFVNIYDVTLLIDIILAKE